MIGAVDRRSRPLRDLRISVTDRCNFRCTYCMPKEIFGRDFAFLPRAELLTFEEITRLARTFARDGVSKIRLTGGEPLLRRDLEQLIAMLTTVEGITDIALTTNGSALETKAQALKDAGLTRVTVSLDALDDATFAAMSDVGYPIARVLAGIDAAASVGLAPVKVNMVVKRGVNGHCILEMAERFRSSGHVLRFIEYMDVGTTNGWRMDEVVPAAEILATINQRWPLEPVQANYPGEVASRYRYRDGAGEIGLIAGHATILRGMHPRATVGRRQALHLPIRHQRPRSPRPATRWAERRATPSPPTNDLDKASRSLLRDAARPHQPAAQDRDVLHRRLSGSEPSPPTRPSWRWDVVSTSPGSPGSTTAIANGATGVIPPPSNAASSARLATGCRPEEAPVWHLDSRFTSAVPRALLSFSDDHLHRHRPGPPLRGTHVRRVFASQDCRGGLRSLRKHARRDIGSENPVVRRRGSVAATAAKA
jgi:cyclic pyranopterin phosphate synthase